MPVIEKVILSLFTLMVSGQVAFGLTNLKKIQVTDATRIDLLFDGKVLEDQIKVEYFNDIVQLSIQNTAVYPAKISSVSGSDLTKVFAYQYAPKLIRCRLTVKGTAQDYQNRVSVTTKGSLVSFKLIPTAVPVAASVQNTIAPKADSERLSEGQKKILDKVLDKGPDAAEVVTKGEVRLTGDAKLGSKPQKTAPIATGKPLPSLGRAFAATFLVLLVFAMVVLAFRKARGEKLKGIFLKMSNLTRLGLTRKSAGMIEVVATHYLGPKKSIAVVKVGGRNLVLGITDESINLITQMDHLSSGESVDDHELMEQVLGQFAPQASNRTTPELFSNTLAHATTRPSIQQGGARARIKSRLEGMKEL